VRATSICAALALATQPACALFASANAAHSHITPCVDDPVFSTIDLVLAAGGAATLLVTGVVDDSVYWLAIPGVFLASGIIGSISAYNCRHKDDDHRAKPEDMGPPVPIDWRAGLPADAGVADAAEVDEPPLPASGPRVKLQLGSDYAVPASDAGTADAQECGAYSGCPLGQSCVLDERNRAFCR
jgi:hypothetical protein